MPDKREDAPDPGTSQSDAAPADAPTEVAQAGAAPAEAAQSDAAPAEAAEPVTAEPGTELGTAEPDVPRADGDREPADGAEAPGTDAGDAEAAGNTSTSNTKPRKSRGGGASKRSSAAPRTSRATSGTAQPGIAQPGIAEPGIAVPGIAPPPGATASRSSAPKSGSGTRGVTTPDTAASSVDDPDMSSTGEPSGHETTAASPESPQSGSSPAAQSQSGTTPPGAPQAATPRADGADEVAASVAPPQEAAGELVRMGLEPASLGLDEPRTIMLPPLESTPPVGSAAPPSAPPGAAPPHGAAAAPAAAAPPHPPGAFPGTTIPAANGVSGASPGVAGQSHGGVSGHTGVPHHGQAPSSGAPPASTTVPGPTVGPPGGGYVGRHPVTALHRPLAAAPADADTSSAAASRTDLTQQLFPEQFNLIVPAGWRRLVRAITFGFFAPGAAAAAEREHQLVSQVRTRLAEPRTVAFVAGKGGVGTTTTAIGVGHTLAALRSDQTVLVDGRSGTASLGERVAEMRAPTTGDLTDGSGRWEPLVFRSPLHLVDAPPWHTPTEPSKLEALLTRLRENFQFTAVDVGNDIGPSGHAALSRADQVVLVTSTRHDAVEATRVVLGRIQDTCPSRLGSLVVAVVGVTHGGHRQTCQRLRDEFGLESSRMLVVPHDPGLVTGGRFDPDRLRTTTREAYLRLAALLADPSTWYQTSHLRLSLSADDPGHGPGSPGPEPEPTTGDTPTADLTPPAPTPTP